MACQNYEDWFNLLYVEEENLADIETHGVASSDAMRCGIL